MKAVWKLDINNKLTEITFVYNTFLGFKKIFVDDKQVLNITKPKREKYLEFVHDKMLFKIELTAEDFAYKPVLITEKNVRYEVVEEEQVIKETPRWVWLFILINYSVPVISVEALSPWVMATIASFLSVKVTQNSKISIVSRIIFCIIINMLLYGAYYLYYLSVKSKGFDGGFIPFL
ncbi:MAG: hypothetical protein AB6733_01980 [Clostridiaceae bacterium]